MIVWLGFDPDADTKAPGRLQVVASYVFLVGAFLVIAFGAGVYAALALDFWRQGML